MGVLRSCSADPLAFCDPESPLPLPDAGGKHGRGRRAPHVGFLTRRAACNVTIHNRCKDTLPNCTKVKQKQQKAALLKNNTALQSVSLRSKTTIRERPSSAIYPSESFRQTLLGSRRGRPTLSLSKSVSTTNIAGTFNDESPLGLRRILSQSTDSLNMNLTLSVESLIDEGAEVMYNQLMSDFEMGL
uniref:Rho guanine nucleotide exchange factor 2 n=1 Tax=Sphaerodactylus townsendi TaxID=933632 RepID=A0ACB8G9U5_9SAUR